MKNLRYGLLGAALVMGVVAAEAKKPAEKPAKISEQGTIVKKLERIELSRDELARRLSYATWECYFDYARRTETMADMSKFKGIRLRALCDTVPALRTLWVADSAAYACWQEVLRTDPEYESIHDEYVSLKGINDRSKNDANTQRYNLMYDRLRRENPDYVPARDSKNRSRRERDEAMARWLLDWYRMQGKAFLTEILPIRILRQECPVIVEMEQELAILQKLQRELREQLLREKYDVKAPVPDEKVIGYTGSAGRTL